MVGLQLHKNNVTTILATATLSHPVFNNSVALLDALMTRAVESSTMNECLIMF